jgi:hypothetical protein
LDLSVPSDAPCREHCAADAYDGEYVASNANFDLVRKEYVVHDESGVNPSVTVSGWYYQCKDPFRLTTSWDSNPNCPSPALVFAETYTVGARSTYKQISNFPSQLKLPGCPLPYRLVGALLGDDTHFQAAFRIDTKLFDMSASTARLPAEYTGWVLYDGIGTKITASTRPDIPPQVPQGYVVSLLVYAVVAE